MYWNIFNFFNWGKSGTKNWKALLIIINEVDATLDGKFYKYSLTSTEIADAKKGANLFPKTIKSNTSGNATLTFPNSPITLKKLTKISYVDEKTKTDVWPDSKNVYEALILQREKWDWGAYDSIFVVHPLPGGGWGVFNPSVNRGSTYATINGKAGWLLTNDGEVFLHEWLHGVCQFLKSLGYQMPDKDADGAGDLGYVKNSSGSWTPYYLDLMTGKIVDKKNGNKPMGGISLDVWKNATLKEPDFYIGFSLKESGYNKNAFKTAFQACLGVPRNDVHIWENGYIQDFSSKDGDYAIMQGKGTVYPTAYLVKPNIWKKFLDSGGAKAFGYPTRDFHLWGGGYIQDFETSNGWHSGIMQEKGKNDLFFVKGNIWRNYVKYNGASGDFGYPATDEFTWFSPKFKMNIQVQYFKNKQRWMWAMTTSPYTCGIDKEH